MLLKFFMSATSEAVRPTIRIILSYLLTASVFVLPVDPARAEAKTTLSLRQALSLAEAFHPAMKISSLQESQARSEVSIRESEYYPHVNLEAIDSSGFAGSSGALGVTGLMGSPFRSGSAYGAVATQNIWDFGRTSNRIDESKALVKAQAEATKMTRYDLDHHVIAVYFECAFNQAQYDTWSEISQASHLVTREVDQFVHTGQRSIVDGFMSRTQEQEAIAGQSDFKKRTQESTKHLSILTGKKEIVCPSLITLNSELGLEQQAQENPFLAFEKQKKEAAQSRLNAARSDYWPKLVAIASLGDMADAPLVQRQSYTLGIGFILPLFEGFATKSAVQQASAALQEQELRVQAAELRLSEFNAEYDEHILSAQAKLVELEKEASLAKKAFDTAKSRYFTAQGSLIDVRDSLRDLSRVLTEKNASMQLYLSKLSQQQIFNGAR